MIKGHDKVLIINGQGPAFFQSSRLSANLKMGGICPQYQEINMDDYKLYVTALINLNMFVFNSMLYYVSVKDSYILSIAYLWDQHKYGSIFLEVMMSILKA